MKCPPFRFFLATEFFLATSLQLKVAKRWLFEKVSSERCNHLHQVSKLYSTRSNRIEYKQSLRLMFRIYLNDGNIVLSVMLSFSNNNSYDINIVYQHFRWLFAAVISFGDFTDLHSKSKTIKIHFYLIYYRSFWWFPTFLFYYHCFAHDVCLNSTCSNKLIIKSIPISRINHMDQ